ncbi:MAG: hypothetical protein HOE53_01710 [Candidatus Magasanikbacteria bacterium]|jgi:hypothetical protein|nr:hypothetical protein [Candidatus Magasanikbacteria bacterium]
MAQDTLVSFLGARNRLINSNGPLGQIGRAGTVVLLASCFQWPAPGFNPLVELNRLLEQAIVFARDGTVPHQRLSALSEDFSTSCNDDNWQEVVTARFEKATKRIRTKPRKERKKQAKALKQWESYASNSTLTPLEQLEQLAQSLTCAPRTSTPELEVLLEQALAYGAALQAKSNTAPPMRVNHGTPPDDATGECA